MFTNAHATFSSIAGGSSRLNEAARAVEPRIDGGKMRQARGRRRVRVGIAIDAGKYVRLNMSTRSIFLGAFSPSAEKGTRIYSNSDVVPSTAGATQEMGRRQ